MSPSPDSWTKEAESIETAKNLLYFRQLVGLKFDERRLASLESRTRAHYARYLRSHGPEGRAARAVSHGPGIRRDGSHLQAAPQAPRGEGDEGRLPRVQVRRRPGQLGVVEAVRRQHRRLRGAQEGLRRLHRKVVRPGASRPEEVRGLRGRAVEASGRTRSQRTSSTRGSPTTG